MAKDSNTCPVLYGVDKIDITMPLLIVEGHIDRLACIEEVLLMCIYTSWC